MWLFEIFLFFWKDVFLKLLDCLELVDEYTFRRVIWKKKNLIERRQNKWTWWPLVTFKTSCLHMHNRVRQTCRSDKSTNNHGRKQLKSGIFPYLDVHYIGKSLMGLVQRLLSVIVMEWVIRVLIPDEAICVTLHANGFVKGANPSLLSPARCG